MSYVDSAALEVVEDIFADIRGRAVIKWLFDAHGSENLIGRFDDGEELRGIDLEVQGKIKAAWQLIVAKGLSKFVTPFASRDVPAMTAIYEQPTGFRDPPFYRHEVTIQGFAHGTIENTARLSGTITGMMAICIQDGRFITVPVAHLRVKAEPSQQENTNEAN